MNKQIILPTDFSKNALSAIRYALDLYEDQECDFHLLNVYRIDDPDLMMTESGEITPESARKFSKERFKKLLQLLHSEFENPKHTFNPISTSIDLDEAVKSIIANKDIDIVIMGTKGATDTTTVFGTNALNLIENVTECPVLAVPKNVRFSPPKEIVFPTDYKTTFKGRELNYLLEIAKSYDSNICVLHIEEKEKRSKKQEKHKALLIEILKETKHSFHELKDLKVQMGINAFIESRDSDMVTFIKRKPTFFRKIFSRSMVKDLAYHSHIPIIALNDYSK